MKKIIFSTLLLLSVCILCPTSVFSNTSHRADVNCPVDPDEILSLDLIDLLQSGEPRSFIPRQKAVEAYILLSSNVLVSVFNSNAEYVINVKDASGAVIVSKWTPKTQKEVMLPLDNLSAGKTYTVEYLNVQGFVAFQGDFTK